jgi:putative transposase
MGRPLRFHRLGAFYHVMLRGNGGQNIFFNDDERQKMCSLIDEGIQRYNHRIHAFCLMSNHIHLLVQVANVPLSVIMQNLASRYCRYFHLCHKTRGHLFQERFKALLVQEECYFKRLLRYIHMNPVNAHLVQKPEDYRWSGHRAYLEEGEFFWLTTHYGLKKFADTLEEARVRYQNYVLKQDSEEDLKLLKDALNNDQILGDDNFKANIRSLEDEYWTPKIPHQVILKSAYEVYEIEEASLSSSSRSMTLIRGAIASLAKKQDISFEEMARIFKRDASSISKAVRQFSEQCAKSEEIQQQYEQFEEYALDLVRGELVQS